MMNPRLLELATRHGALQVRIAAQRQQLAQHAGPLEAALARGDQALDGIDWLKQHPGAVAAFVAAFAVVRPRRAFRWAKRGFFLWRGWQSLRQKMTGR